jgi:hypothetical protein
MSKPASRAEAALDELCVGYGYCLLGEKAEALLANVPEDPDAFVDAVLSGEGLDPAAFDKGDRQQLLRVVRDWLFADGQGRGTKSGLPRLPHLAGTR